MNKIIKSLMCSLMFLLFSISAITVEAGIFKCVSTTGKVYFIDKPCPVDNKETELQAVKDPLNGYIPPVFVPDEVEGQKLGVVVGTDAEATTDSEDDYESGSSIIGGNNQSKGQKSQKENTTNSKENVASQRTESDKIYNSKLKAQSKRSKTGSANAPLKKVLVLEPSG